MGRIVRILCAVMFLPCMLVAYKMDFSEEGAVQTGKGEGYVELRGRNGETILRYADKSQARFRDGTAITRYMDGSRDIAAPDGTTIRVEYDSSVRYTYPNGKVVNISMDGKTPFGMDVEERRNVLRKGAISIEITYAAKQSDYSPDKYMENYFRELNDSIRVALDAGRIPEGEYHVVISNCRFCKTGYCRRKNKVEIEVSGWKKDGKTGDFSFSHEAILTAAGRKDIVNRTVDEMVKGWTAGE